MITDTSPKENGKTIDPVHVQESASEHNAFLIRPAKGAAKGLKAIKDELKAQECHWHQAVGAWCCALYSKERVSSILKSKNLEATFTACFDSYFEKSPNQKEAETMWNRIDILEQEHQREAMRLLSEKAAVEQEIEARELSLDDPCVLEKKQLLEQREEKQAELVDEIGRLRNSAKLMEESQDEIPFPFQVLGYNSQNQILIWQEGRITRLPTNRLNKDELRLLVGGHSKWFQIPEGERLLKNRLIDKARAKGFINDEIPLKAGVWFLKGKWLVISAKQAAVIENGKLKYLEEPLFEGKLIETNVASWLDWDILEKSLNPNLGRLKAVFDRLLEKVRLWNWKEPSMAAHATAFFMLSIVQQAMKWRPWIYVTGAKSTGKSTFFEVLLQVIFGVLVERLDKSTAHATAQTVGNSGRIPVFDEFEKHKQIPEILELMKLCNKGGQKTSGTGAEKAHRYGLHHMPWFGSIYLPKRMMQDAAQESRTVKLELKKLKEGTPLLEGFDAEEASKLAAEIVGGLIASWKEIESKAQEINANRNLLIQELPGLEIRTIENFMYAASLLIQVNPELADPIIPSWSLTQSEDDGDKLLDAIFTSIVKMDGGSFSIGELLQLSAKGLKQEYEKELDRYGLRLTCHKTRKYLAVRCENITRHLLKDTDYAALDIKGPLSRIEGAIATEPVKMAGGSHRCVLLPIERIGIDL